MTSLYYHSYLATFEAVHAGALVVVLQVLAGAVVLARRRQALVDVLLAAIARIAYITQSFIYIISNR